MELYQLRTFVTVAEEGHLTRAAGRLFTSQPAISAHIKALEEELGVPLFVRTPKGMQLTREGELLKAQAEKALDTIKEMHHQAKALQGDILGTVRLGLNIDPRFLKISEFFSMMSSRYPRLEFHLLQNMSWEVLDKIKSGKLDAGYIFGNNEHPEIVTIPLSDFNLRIVGPAQWKDDLKGADWLRIAEMPWIWVPPMCPYYKIVGSVFEKKGLKPFKVALADGDYICRALVSSGVGLTVMIEDEALEAQKEGKIAIWEKERFQVNLSFAYLGNRLDDPDIRTVIDGICTVWGVA
jgi:DNA-binding transcriptional LysR family regulator